MKRVNASRRRFANNKPPRAPTLMAVEALEPRLLMSADAFGATLLSDANVADDVHTTDDREHQQHLADLIDSARHRNHSPISVDTLPPSLDLSSLSQLHHNDDSRLLNGEAASVGLDELAQLVVPDQPDHNTRHEVIFVDTTVDDYQTLLNGLISTDNSVTYTVIQWQPGMDAFEQFSEQLTGLPGADAVHIISHGNESGFQFGEYWLRADNINQFQQPLQQWRALLNADADLLLYGCQVAASESGKALISQLALLTGADVAASDDLTGASTKGGDWRLEYQHGAIDSAVAFSVSSQQAFSTVLADQLAISTRGSVSGIAGNTGSLGSWAGDQVIIAGDPGLNLAAGSTSATFTLQFDIGDYAAGANIDAIHFVSSNLTIGTSNTVDVHQGDLLLSLDANHRLTGSDSFTLNVGRQDVFIFRPDSPGDYSSGRFIRLLEDPGGMNADVNAISLIEQSTTFADVTLQAGDFLMSYQGDTNNNNILLFDPQDLNASAIGSTSILVNGGDDNGNGAIINDFISGLDLVETDTTVGGVTLNSATIIVSIRGDKDVMDNQLPVQMEDLFSLSLSQTTLGSGSAAGTAAILFQGEDVNLDSDIDGFSLLGNSAPSGTVTIDGSAVEDATLSADTSALADADGLGSFSYQWLRAGVAISGATAASYTLTDADVGQVISVAVSYTDGAGVPETVTSEATGVVSNINDLPTGTVTISGVATQGQTLSAETVALADADGLGTFSYQWRRDGADIAGATDVNYTLIQSDVGAEMSVVVRYTDGYGTQESTTSAPTAAVSNINDTPTGSVTISGLVVEDQLLSANTSSIADADGLGSFSFQWRRDGADIAGATGANYQLTDNDVGAHISVVVSYTDGQGNPETLISADTAAVLNINDTPDGAVIVSGNATENQMLIADTSTLSDADGLGSFSYQWLRDGLAIPSANAVNYTLSAADVGSVISVQVSYTDGAATIETVTSSDTAAVAPASNNLPSGAVLITGSAVEGQAVAADTTSLTDADGLGTFSYQWRRDGADIAGASGGSYTLTQDDVDARISVVVRYTDGAGTQETVTSAATAAVLNTNNAPSGSVVINGIATEDQTLSADTSSIADVDGLGAFSYQWRRNGVDISGANGASYQLTDNDVGARLSVVVSYTDAEGTLETVISASTSAVSNTNDNPTGAVTIDGNATENQVLTANTSSLSDADGLGTLSYQWLRDGMAISGATTASYTLTDADVGAQISVRVIYVDGQGTQESINSTATLPVTNINDPVSGDVTVSGSVTEDQTLSADTTALRDDDGLGSFVYQWRRDGVVVVGASSVSYTLSDTDVGARMSVVVSYVDAQGTQETVASVGTGPVVNVNDPVTGDVTIVGTALPGRVLTADTSGLADDDGLGAFSYQWLRGNDVAGSATGSSYLLTDDDNGSAIRVIVSYTDANGSQESVTSSPVIVAVPPSPLSEVNVDQALDSVVTPEELTAEELTPEELPVTIFSDEGAGDQQAQSEQPSDNNNEQDNSRPDRPVISAGVVDHHSVLVTSLDETSDLSGFNTAFGDSSQLSSVNVPVDPQILTRDSVITGVAQALTWGSVNTAFSSFIDPLVLVDVQSLTDELDELREQVTQDTPRNQTVLGGTVAVTAGLSTGYAVWLLRSGVLLSSALSALPAWRFIDPLPILTRGKDGIGEADEESLQSIVAAGATDDESMNQSEKGAQEAER